MRRMTALLAGVILALVFAGSAVAGPRDGFVGDFTLLSDDGATTLGQVEAQLGYPTAARLVPGGYDFFGAPDNDLRESHSQLRSVSFWYDPGNGSAGANVAFADGVECIYWRTPGDVLCHEFAVMFVDNLAPTDRDQVAFADSRIADGPYAGDWDFTMWFKVGPGAFNLKYSGN